MRWKFHFAGRGDGPAGCCLEDIKRHYSDTLLSVDTFRADVARRCVEEYGVAIVNDISGGELDHEMFDTVARLRVPYIMMHMRGTPQTMQQHTDYTDMMRKSCCILPVKSAGSACWE